MFFPKPESESALAALPLLSAHFIAWFAQFHEDSANATSFVGSERNLERNFSTIEVRKAIAMGGFQQSTVVFVSLLITVISAVTVFGNALVMLSFYLDSRLRIPSNYYFLSLAVSDFIIGLEGFPVLTHYVVEMEWTLGYLICDLWLAVDYSVCHASIYAVLFITIDQFCSVCSPVTYRKHRSHRSVLITIIMIWAIPLLFFFTIIFGWPYFTGHRELPSFICMVQFMQYAILNMCLYIGYYWSTLLVMIILYTGICRKASKLRGEQLVNERKLKSMETPAGDASCTSPSDHRSSTESLEMVCDVQSKPHDDNKSIKGADEKLPTKKMGIVEAKSKKTPCLEDSKNQLNETFNKLPWVGRKLPKPDNESASKYRTAKKAVRTITVLFWPFIILWTPFYVLATMIAFCPNCVPADLYTASYYMCYMNSVIHPFCYALANAQFKKTFIRILKGDFQRV